MDKKAYYLISAIFLFGCGLVYTLERMLAYYLWSQSVALGNIAATLALPRFFANPVIPVFLLIALATFIAGYRKG